MRPRRRGRALHRGQPLSRGRASPGSRRGDLRRRPAPRAPTDAAACRGPWMDRSVGSREESGRPAGSGEADGSGLDQGRIRRRATPRCRRPVASRDGHARSAESAAEPQERQARRRRGEQQRRATIRSTTDPAAGRRRGPPRAACARSRGPSRPRRDSRPAAAGTRVRVRAGAAASAGTPSGSACG